MLLSFVFSLAHLLPLLTIQICRNRGRHLRVPRKRQGTHVLPKCDDAVTGFFLFFSSSVLGHFGAFIFLFSLPSPACHIRVAMLLLSSTQYRPTYPCGIYLILCSMLPLCYFRRSSCFGLYPFWTFISIPRNFFSFFFFHWTSCLSDLMQFTYIIMSNLTVCRLSCIICSFVCISICFETFQFQYCKQSSSLYLPETNKPNLITKKGKRKKTDLYSQISSVIISSFSMPSYSSKPFQISPAAITLNTQSSPPSRQ